MEHLSTSVPSWHSAAVHGAEVTGTSSINDCLRAMVSYIPLDVWLGKAWAGVWVIKVYGIALYRNDT